MKVDITVSIINYNYGRFLKRTIDSVYSQNWGRYRFEVLLIDDGSTDETNEVVKEYLTRGDFIHSRTANQGFPKSLSRAIEEANGTYVFLLDADDFFLEGKIINVMKLLDGDLWFVADTSNYYDENGKLMGLGTNGSTSTIAINREGALPLLPVENELSFHVLNDIGKGAVCSVVYTGYTLHSSSMTNRNVAGKQNQYLARITFNLVKRIQTLCVEFPVEWSGIVSVNRLRKIGYQYLAQANYNMLEAALELKQRNSSFRFLGKMWYWQIRSGRLLKPFAFKMIIKAILQRPSFPK